MYTGVARAPEFPPQGVWFNTESPLRFSHELKGKVVILDFWTYCCINCMHILPDLAYLEKKYAHDPVAFIGVHSNKYTNEADPVNIREAILRYGISHPVIVDENHKIWNAFGIHAWPTLVVVDSTGNVLGAFSGEGHRDELDRIIAALLEVGRKEGTLSDTPIPHSSEEPHHTYSGLSYPGKIIADAPGRRLFIADSAHNRIIITDWNGEIQGFFGSGIRGFVDGSYSDVRFNNPQGMTLFGKALYIADTDNHAVRRADLSAFHVDTILGNGMIGFDRHGGHRGRDQLLNSPWDLAMLGGELFIAMAGLHQIWTYDPRSEVAQAALGTGREDIADNFARKAALAQPSGLAAHEGSLYFADSETSAVRKYDPASGQVTTLVGQGLFTFGDMDGDIEQALFQHPLGVAAEGNSLYVADTYNHKIRRIDLRTGKVDTLIGKGEPGREMEGKPLLYEPGGLSVAGNDLFIADTNNDRVLHYRIDTGAWREITPSTGGIPLSEAA